MTTRLQGLPAFEIVHIEPADNPRLHGVFTHLRSVKAGRSWLYHPADPLIGDLLDLDEATGRAVVEAPFWHSARCLGPRSLQALRGARRPLGR